MAGAYSRKERIMKKLFSLFSVSILFVFLMYLPAEARKVDLQYWHSESIDWKLAEKWKAVFSEEQRIDDDASHLYYQEQDIGVVYSGFAEWFDLSLNFKHVLSESKDNWSREERPHFAGTFKFKLLDFSFSDRVRFEYRIREKKSDIWRYRNLLTITFPYKLTSLEIQPYIAEEILIDDVISETRSYGGFSFKILKGLGAKIFYLQKRNRLAGGDWIGANVVGTSLKVSF